MCTNLSVTYAMSKREITPSKKGNNSFKNCPIKLTYCCANLHNIMVIGKHTKC